MYHPDDPASVEKYSSAVTLSDMEVFVFPELMMSLVLANCMSDSLWQWKRDPWFAAMSQLSPSRRIHRLRQFIVDHFTFNLDLDTWGLTTKDRELSRFNGFVDQEILAQSNALFGYEGDKYYFDIDIRRHFGLDKYTTEVIPYWKTETIEAMEAFRFKDGYSTGAGECVSLSSLYASALVVVGGIALDKIFMLATPLHSQNFVDIGEGFITNNRRVVTKSMWFNGTEISAKARRALLNERVTIVLNNSGYVHTLYPDATMPVDQYRYFRERLTGYLRTDISFEILVNFLRDQRTLQRCFQFSHSCCGKPRFIEAEKVFQYEHSSKSRAGDRTRKNLLHEIDEDEYYPEPVKGRIVLDELEEFFSRNPVSLESPAAIEKLKTHLRHTCYNVEEVVSDLLKFCRIIPRLPDEGTKRFETTTPISLEGITSREELIDRVEALRSSCPAADLAFTAYRDLNRSPWKPFLKAALQRNPVSVHGAGGDLTDAAGLLESLPEESIYPDPSRMAQPDEVWNFGRGDGLEKAICLLNVARNRFSQEESHLDGDGADVVVRAGHKEFRFKTRKLLTMPRQEDFRF